jgi:adenine phosphoribosyltransferase
MDDLLATGGTACAAVELIRSAGGVVAGLSVVIELEFLSGRNKLESLNVPISSLITYE